MKRARARMAELLAEDGSAVDGGGPALVAEPREITHPVKFYENGDRPLEFVSTRQWFVEVLDHKQALIEQGRSTGQRCDALLVCIAHSDYDAASATAVALGTRYYKRISAHATNVLTSVVMPLHKLDYYDEDIAARRAPD